MSNIFKASSHALKASMAALVDSSFSGKGMQLSLTYG